MLNTLTDGLKVSNSDEYPGDVLLTTANHVLLLGLAQAGLINFTQSATAPASPSTNQIWYKPDTGLAAGNAPQGNAAIFRWNGASWDAMTPTHFANYLATLAGLRPLPGNAAGLLRNDGAGGLSWDANALSTQELVNQTGNITLSGQFDVVDLTLSGNITLNALSSFPKNKPMFVRIRQPAATPRTISLNTTVFKKGAIDFVPSTTVNAIDVIGLICRSADAVAEICMFNRGVQ